MKTFIRIFNRVLCIGNFLFVWMSSFFIKDKETFLIVEGMIVGAGIMGLLNLVLDPEVWKVDKGGNK